MSRSQIGASEEDWIGTNMHAAGFYRVLHSKESFLKLVHLLKADVTVNTLTAGVALKNDPVEKKHGPKSKVNIEN